MDLSKRWLSDHVDLDVTDKKFADKMTLSGSKVESQSCEGSKIKNIVVGHIESITRHENSDHMWVCQVDAGTGENIQIVTGAQNLKEGDYVPAALHHSCIADGREITRGKLRGVMSNGMLCSLSELGLTIHDFPYAIEDGIFVLGDDCDKTVGKDIRDAIGLNDVITEFEITSNRSDCLSVTGLAREAAATFGVQMKTKEPVVPEGSGNVNDIVKVSIQCPDKCYRYTAAAVRNVKVGPSPRWIRERLRASGVRPINNIVDITNFVMLEYGQPMHAYDAKYVHGGNLIARDALPGERLMTLDGTERDLTADMTVIADDEKALGIAGLMGGEHSEITDETTDLIFESACFNGAAIRRASKALGLRTEASSRFEKALTPALCMTALKRALELIGMLDAGEVVGGIIDVDVSNYKPVTLPFQPEWVNGFIGIDCSAERQKQILESIGFTVKDGIITVPGFRNDISHKADISEEIARFYGYDNIPDRKLSGAANAALTDEQKFLKRADNLMRSYGLTEIFTYSFMSPKNYDKICLAKDSPERRCVTISNPLGEDTSVMRTTAIPSMLDILSRNYNYRNDSAALYETATVYIPKDSDTLPDEDKKLVIGMYGQQYDFFSLKGAVEQLLALEGITDYDVCAVTDDPTFHPGRTADVRKDGRLIARLGEIHPQVCRNFEIDTRAYCAQIDLKTVFDLRNEDRTYEPLPKFPAVTRDIALVCDASLPVLTLSRAIRKAAGKNVESVSLFDVYQGEQIEKGKKSVAFNLKLRSKEGTLTDEQCDAVMSKAVKAVESLGAVLRS